MSNLDKARVWAESVGNIEGLMPGTRATVEVIQSLPDQWVSAEEVKAIIAGMNCCVKKGSETDFSDGFNGATTAWRDALEALLTPKLPTLADMTAEEREACQWMQAQTWHEVGVVVLVDEMTEIAKLITRTNDVLERKFKDVTPLPDLPKLQWPGSEVVEPPALPEGMRLADHARYGRVVVSPGVDSDDDYKTFCSDQVSIWGAAWKYTHKSQLTFLDGGE